MTDHTASGRRIRHFQPAEKATRGARFLQNVAKIDPPPRSRTKHKLTRVTFTVSRLMEFCSKRERWNKVQADEPGS